jgi:hypothetical protein
VLKRIYDMPAGTLGFEAVGEVEDDDVEPILAPALRQWTAESGKISGPSARGGEGIPHPSVR